MILRLEGTVKHYAWGGYEYLPNLFSQENKDQEPCAEYWLGTHPDGDAQVIDGPVKHLSHLVSHRNTTKGIKDSLPFLLKVLDVRDMLSIQLHPDKATAEVGYQREETEGIDRKAYNRVYRDQNHKPELMVALSDFWLVQGFKQESKIRETLNDRDELKKLVFYLDQGSIQSLYNYIMTAPQDEINQLLKPLGKRIKPLYESNQLSKDNIDFWAARAFLTFNRKGICDRGILSLYLMNLINLKPGEGSYQSPGVLHAYMEGQNVECMATSDNVVRGGLTPKHIDTSQLLEIISFDMGDPEIIKPGSSDSFNTYVTPAPDFQLMTVTKAGNRSLNVSKPRIILVVNGICRLTTNTEEVTLDRGQSVVVYDEPNLSIDLPDDGLVIIASEGK